MATIKPNDFTEFDLSESEELAGQILSLPQEQVLRNRLAAYATSKINLQFDPTNPIQFAQVEAELAGKILVIREMIDTSELAKQFVIDKAIQDSNEE